MEATGLRIALVGPLPPPSGGMANQTLQLAKLLREEGATVELIQVNRPYSPRWIAKVQGVRAFFRLLPYLVDLWQSANNVQLYHVMANSGWSWHLFAAPAIWIALLRGKPVIINYRGGEADVFFEKSHFWIKPSLHRANAIIVPSDFLKTVFGKHGFLADIVPNIINLGRFNTDRNSPSLPSVPLSPCILVARNLEAIYDNASALRAFHIVRAAFPAAQLILAGSGPEQQALEQLAAELSLTDCVTFTGRVDNQGMAALYRKADVMINPSLADNMPNSILEALASGVPVVSTNVGGVPYLVEHGKTALLVPAQNPAAMAGAILALLNDPAMAKRIAEAGLESVQQYTWATVKGRLLQVYEKILAKRNNPIADTK